MRPDLTRVSRRDVLGEECIVRAISIKWSYHGFAVRQHQEAAFVTQAVRVRRLKLEVDRRACRRFDHRGQAVGVDSSAAGYDCLAKWFE